MKKNNFSPPNPQLSIQKGFIKHQKSCAGFTLIEILLVIALIGVLAASLIIIINPVTQFQRTRDAQRKNDLSQIQKALEQYYNDNRKYPDSSSEYTISNGSTSYPWGTPWPETGLYLSTLPKDPATNQRYIYVPTSDRQGYYLYAHLEQIRDFSACNTQGLDCPQASSGGSAQIPSNSCSNPGGTLSCNYGTTSPNLSP